MRGVICKVNQFDVREGEWFDIERIRTLDGSDMPPEDGEAIEVRDRVGDWYCLLPEEYEVVR